jgi:polyhydroxybutyrate depolymerase
LVAIAALAALLAIACGGSSDEQAPAASPTASLVTEASAATATAPPNGATGAPTSATGCSPARPHDAGTSNETIVSDGIERTYLLEVPPAYDGSDPVPLVLNLHGFGSTAQEQAAYSRFPAKGAAEGFIVLTPQGTGDPPYWNIVGVGALTDDVAFFRTLLDALEAQLCIDAFRVYATGISNGAGMSSRLACELGDRIAAIGTVAGTSFPRNCDPGRPMPVIAFHGTEDALVPYGGGPINAGLGLRFNLQAAPVEESIASWAEHNGCTTGPAREGVAANIERIVYTGCVQNASVELYAIEGGGHTWPGAAMDVPRLGVTTHEIGATELIWAFFLEHPMP